MVGRRVWLPDLGVSALRVWPLGFFGDEELRDQVSPKMRLPGGRDCGFIDAPSELPVLAILSFA